MGNANKGSSFWELALSFLVGSTTGFILGVLFAPASGKETRNKIREGAAKAGEKAKESYAKFTKEAEKGIKIVKERTQEGLDSLKDFVEKKKKETTKKESAKKA
jgi:gas vesicle protein